MQLSNFELEIMQLFWKNPESTAPSIHQLVELERPVSYSTVKTIIDRLEKKGALTRTRQKGRTIYYSPLVEKAQLSKPMIKSFINRLFLGNSRPLVAQLLQEEELSLDDIGYLEAILKKRKEELK